MSTELVIKVKYGETLRRFSVLFNGNGSLDLNMAGLRDKIFNLFKFTADADVSLTYVDEDNDMVTLVDDADLSDAIKQHLDPLRIVVSLNSDSGGKLDTSGSSTPMRSPRTTSVGPPPFYIPKGLPPYMAPPPFSFARPSPFTPINRQLPRDLTLKASSSTESVPGQDQSPSKLLQDLASKVASAAPEQYRDFISKLSHNWLSKTVAASHAPLVLELVEILSNLGISNQDQGSKDQIGTVSNKASDLEKTENCEVSDNLKTSKDSMATSEVLSNAKNDNLAYNAANLSRTASTSDSRNAVNVEVFNDPKNSGVAPGSDFTPLICCNRGNQSTAYGFASPSTALPLDGLAKPLAPQKNDSASGQKGLSASVPVQSGWSLSGRSYGHYDNMGRVFHRGVRCDGCGVHPITGPRYKSKVKEDYDLCSICFVELGNAAEYTRMDRPMCYRSPQLPKSHHPRVEGPVLLPHGLRRSGLRSSYRPKVDSCFIEDVNIVDGTLMAPLTPFTKIWRMHNNGDVAWPRGTQLVWIGGDQLTDVESFEVEITSEGCLVGMELNVAIDFVAPERHGRYISHWRMALPSGQKFGQHIWVLIQVDTPQGDSHLESVRSLNLNLPPDCGDLKDDQIIDVNVEPVDDSHQEVHSNMMAAELVKPTVDGCTSKEMEANSRSIPTEVPAVESYPLIDFSVVPNEPSPITDVNTFSADGNTLEHSLLKELDDMGFKEIGLNKEILRVNEYNLERSLDDLCGVAEWDPMLEELQEMGFYDKETNRRLLIKNGGSIKRVVMDLIAAEKA